MPFKGGGKLVLALPLAFAPAAIPGVSAERGRNF